MSGSSRSLDRLATTFNHEGLVANAGLILAGTLMARLGLSGLIERWVRTGSANPGPEDSHGGRRDGRGRHSHRSRRDAARRAHRAGAGVPPGGALDGRDVLADVHVRSRPPARSGAVAHTGSRLGTGRGPRRDAAGGRSGLHDLGGPRQTKTRRRVRPAPKSSAITRCSPHAPTPAKCSAPACAKAPRGPREAWSASSTSSPRTCDEPGLPGRPRCAPTRDSGPAN